MWIDCEKNSNVIWYYESQCERNSSHIVRRLWGNCDWRWIPLMSEVGRGQKVDDEIDMKLTLVVQKLRIVTWVKQIGVFFVTCSLLKQMYCKEGLFDADSATAKSSHFIHLPRFIILPCCLKFIAWYFLKTSFFTWTNFTRVP